MRISREQMFLDMAESASRRSTCFRGNTGCLIVKDNDPVSMGYNGPPSGDEHCKGNKCELRTDGGCLRSVHAEWNAIRRAQQKMNCQLLTHCDLYTMSGPCPGCADHILFAGIWRVFYRFPYRDPSGIQKLIERDTTVFRVTPSGYVVNEKTGEVVTLSS